ncbi:MAG TPA: O-antigen ligase family protein [Candidatus Polarisedimenticolaceae bacterium]|nr:O-antigen ligase family protein [Candidatus Polarisedimenticolaceae bacterium]
MSRRSRSRRGEVWLGTADLLLLATAVGLPWFWGGVAQAASRSAAALIGAAVAWTLIRRGTSGLGLDREARWLAPAVLLGLFALLQTVPLPRSWVAAVSPRAAALQRETFGEGAREGSAWLRGLEERARTRVPECAAVAPSAVAPADPALPSPPAAFTLSLQPSATRERLFWYAALLLAFVLAQSRAQDRAVAGHYRTALFAGTGALIAVGIANRLTAPHRLLWILDAPTETKPFGPYVNPNHFVGVMELMVPWLLGHGLASLSRRGDEPLGAGSVLPLAVGVAGAAATVLAGSKTATMTIGASSLLLLAAAMRRQRARRTVMVFATATAVLLAVIAALGPLSMRISDYLAVYGPLSAADRAVLWRAGLPMIGDFPVTGSGFGAFREVIGFYLPRGEPEHWLQMHNDYLEIAVGGGAIALGLLAWLAAGYGARFARALRAERAQNGYLPGLGLLLGLASLAVHEAVDFNLQVPANALLFVVAAAIGVAPAARRTETSS